MTIRTITGTVEYADGAIPQNSRLEFHLNGIHIDEVTIAHSAVYTPLDETGDITVDLYPNDVGYGADRYNVDLVTYSDSEYIREIRRVNLGKIFVEDEDGQILQDLLAVFTGPAVPLGVAQQAAQDAIDAAAAAAASAALAALHGGTTLDTVADLLSDTALTYTAGQPGTVVAGDLVNIRADNSSLEVLASGATVYGYLTAGGVKLKLLGGGLEYNAAKVITRFTPEVPERDGDPNWFPSGGAPYLNVIIGADGPSPTAPIWRSTIIGNSIATLASNAVDRADLFGDGVLRFGDYVDSLTAMGSLAAQWLGLQLEAGEDMSDALRRTKHEFCKDPTDPDLTDPAWDMFGLETANPGLRAKMAAVTPAASKADNEDNALFGRNAWLHAVKGKRNTIIGKNALAHGWFNTELTVVGWGAARNGAMLNHSAMLGSQAGFLWSEGSNNVVVGPGAGLNITKGNSNVIIGPDAAQSYTGEVNSLFWIGAYTDRPPLLSGSFGARHVGINIDRGDILATGLHVRAGNGGTGGAANAAASTLIVEQSSGNGGIGIMTDNASIGQINFGRVSLNAAGSIRYAHASDEMQFRANNVLNLRLGNATMGFYGTAPVAKPTGVAVSVAGIHAALVTLGLIAA